MDRFTIKHKTLSEFTSDDRSISSLEPKQNYTKAKAGHPVQMMQENKAERGEQLKLREVSALYGSALAMRLVKERSLLGMQERPVGKSSMHGLQMHMGRYSTLEFEDVLGHALPAMKFDTEARRKTFEQKMGV